MSKQELIDFETAIAKDFAEAKIRGPVHLSDGNEDQLIEFFQRVHPQDWIFSTWRSHYHALLHGIDSEWLRQEILAGRSITIFNREHKFFSSAIVGGILPIAVGTALGIKRSGRGEHVWAFVGDMCAETGAFHESVEYAQNLDLPIDFVIEDNGISTTTPTRLAWGLAETPQENLPIQKVGDKIWYYSYKKEKYPHQGIGVFIHF